MNRNNVAVFGDLIWLIVSWLYSIQTEIIQVLILCKIATVDTEIIPYFALSIVLVLSYLNNSFSGCFFISAEH